MSNIELLFIVPPLNLQLLINGLLVGALFALAAYGMALVWGVMNVINIAQGEFVILGGYVTVLMVESGIPPLYAVIVAPIILYGVGWAIYRTVIHRVVDKDLFISLLATFGISILLQQMMNQIFGADIRGAEHGFPSWSMFEGLVTIEQVKVFAMLISGVIGLILVVFLRKSRTGQAIRATAQNPRAARIMGINTDRVYAVTYGLNAAICGAAGALVPMIWAIEPYSGLVYTIRAFMIAIIAGLGNLLGVVIAGLGLGAMENFAGFILGSEFQMAFVFGLLVVILVTRGVRMGRRREILK